MSVESSASGAGAAGGLIPARIDRLPWSPFHTRMVIALGVAWILDGLEITVASTAGSLLTERQTLSLSSTEVGFIASVYLIGEVVGALLIGIGVVVTLASCCEVLSHTSSGYAVLATSSGGLNGCHVTPAIQTQDSGSGTHAQGRKPKRCNCQSHEPTSSTAPPIHSARTGSRASVVSGSGASSGAARKTSAAMTVTGLASSAAHQCPAPASMNTVVEPQNGQGTPVSRRSGHNAPGSWFWCSQAAATDTAATAPSRTATAAGSRSLRVLASAVTARRATA